MQYSVEFVGFYAATDESGAEHPSSPGCLSAVEAAGWIRVREFRILSWCCRVHEPIWIFSTMNTMKTFMLMALMTALVVVIGRMLGGQSGMLLAFLFAVAMNFGSYWFSDKIVLRMYRAKEVTESQAPQLYSMVQDLAGRAGLPMPRVYVIPGDQPNAFATGRNPEHAAVAVTEGIMKTLTPDELRGVIGHELAHVKHRDILIGTIAATMAGAISMIAHMAQWAMIFGGGRGSDRRREQSPRYAHDDHSGTHCCAADSDGHLALAGVFSRRGRCADCGESALAGRSAQEAG